MNYVIYTVFFSATFDLLAIQRVKRFQCCSTKSFSASNLIVFGARKYSNKCPEWMFSMYSSVCYDMRRFCCVIWFLFCIRWKWNFEVHVDLLGCKSDAEFEPERLLNLVMNCWHESVDLYSGVKQNWALKCFFVFIFLMWLCNCCEITTIRHFR